MAESIQLDGAASRQEQYRALAVQWDALFQGEPNRTANLANVAAVLKTAFKWHWVGFYVVDERRGELVLGPFQGPLACTRLFKGKGVCAAAWQSMQPQIVGDVNAFEGHVVCSALSQSELVLPILVQERVVAVLDIDSENLEDFSSLDVSGLAPLIQCIEKEWIAWEN